MLPLLIHGLPLKEDMEENNTVYSCILHLFESNNPSVSVELFDCADFIMYANYISLLQIMAHIQPILRVIAAELLPTSKLSNGIYICSMCQMLLHFISFMCRCLYRLRWTRYTVLQENIYYHHANINEAAAGL